MVPDKSQSSASTLITTGLNDSLLGDVLLFVSPDSSCQNTKIISAFTHTTYYTITTDSCGFHTRVYRGDAKGNTLDGFFSHIATISTANGHRVWESTERGEYKERFSRDKSTEGEPDEKIEDSLDSADEFLEEKGGRDEKSSRNTRPGRTDVLSSEIRKQSDVFLIEYGKGASKTLRECVKLEKGSVTIQSGNTTYAWRLQDGHPALYAIDPLETRQVIWTRPPHINATPTTTSTFPATLTFYPETRTILDAVMIALVIWERKVKMG